MIKPIIKAKKKRSLNLSHSCPGEHSVNIFRRSIHIKNYNQEYYYNIAWETIFFTYFHISLHELYLFCLNKNYKCLRNWVSQHKHKRSNHIIHYGQIFQFRHVRIYYKFNQLRLQTNYCNSQSEFYLWG